MEPDVELKLKRLILDEQFTSLQNLVNKEVNLMDILRVSQKELQHSNFLAWAFNPNESHNLGDFIVKEFIKIYFHENGYQDLGFEHGLSVFDFAALDFDDLEIRREYKNIDLILLSNKNKLSLTIENKIYSGERKGQLKKYREQVERDFSDFKYKIYIYLSLEDQVISEDERDCYIQLNYTRIVKVIENTLSSRKVSLAQNTRFVFEQYLQTLKSMLNMNKEIEDVVQELYKEYKVAFDLVFKYAMIAEANETNAISNELADLISKEPSITPFVSNRTYRRFHPIFLQNNLSSLQKIGIASPGDKLEDGWIYLFEFNIRKDKVTFDFKIGNGDQSIRTKLYQIYKKYPNIFTTGLKKELSPQWHLVFQREILSKRDIECYLYDDNDTQNLLVSRFNTLIAKDIKKIIECLENEIKQNASEPTNSH